MTLSYGLGHLKEVGGLHMVRDNAVLGSEGIVSYEPSRGPTCTTSRGVQEDRQEVCGVELERSRWGRWGRADRHWARGHTIRVKAAEFLVGGVRGGG